jgi:hypothetical protein
MTAVNLPIDGSCGLVVEAALDERMLNAVFPL